MADLRIYFNDNRIGQKFSRGVQRNRDRVLASMRGTGQAAKKELEQRLPADVRQAPGLFAKSARWVQGFTVAVTEGGGTIRISAKHKVPYFIVFARPGGTDIHGKPELAIPLPFAHDAQGVLARNFPGGLFRVDRPGKASLLLSRVDHEPKYFLKEKVHLPQKFKTFAIIRDVANRLRDTYKKQLRAQP